MWSFQSWVHLGAQKPSPGGKVKANFLSNERWKGCPVSLASPLAPCLGLGQPRIPQFQRTAWPWPGSVGE